ncbi:MAG: hypothetical protein MI923_10180 [Phycisphaerales bacterium]|nr:hypothetical protein [Phycisphaerales bacterium]
MMNRIFVAAAVFLSSAAGVVFAQVDHRVDYRVPGSDGRLLDSNPQVGSGGRNPRTPYRFDGGRQSNAAVTGNLTGLARFHGGTPVIQSNQFRSALPSAGLSGFLGTSVGLEAVRANRTLQPTFYLPRAETIADLGFIRSGLNRPGSSTLRSTLTRRPLPQTRQIPDRLPEIPDPTDIRLYVNRAVSTTPGTRQRPLFPADETSGIDGRLPFSSAARSSIFGTPRPVESPGFVSPFERLRSIDSKLSGPLNEPIRPLSPVPEMATKPELGTSILPALAGPQSNVRRSMEAQDGRDDAPGAKRSQRAEANTSPFSGEKARSWNLGEDRFTDLQNAVRAAQKTGQQGLGFASRGQLDAIDRFGAESAPQKTDSQAPDSARRDVGEELTEVSAALRWTKGLLEDPIKSFVGRFDDRLNQYLTAAEAALHRGEYYSASRWFNLAHTVDPRNPLPLLGRGHALVAAGDYLSAALMLEQGLSRFPQIAAFRLDLPSLVGQHDIFDIRRADLEKRLSIAEHYELRFLLGYLELYSGLQTEGLRNLELAAKHAPQDSVISIFPDLVLGRRELPALNDARP